MGAPLPMLIHCATDDDRTGLVVAAIQLLCGVCRSAIIADYVRSDENHVPSVKKAPPIDDIEIFLKAIDAQGVIGFWNSCGLSTYEINSLYLRLCAGSGDTSPTELANHADLNEDCFEAQAENVPYSQPAMSADATSTPCQRRAFLPLALSPRGSRSSSQKVIDGPLVVKKLKMDTEVEASGYRQPYIGPSNADE
ncbi:hypothetical protein SARC_08188 [Sphaeroforma arctica JP610]|uniref:Tyrosine specific protein phosphatases domain-containing protein n=1 Tax=Sphaeroforma arctica JP610 TaxID=667725 RepID=A0A0L0FS44_9EUKA|nr:hypothetical protein SARC_08188 [Sphaeroforma arctica JP610]KNC79421.1 hypothetical protein SARC_08188 [Sphaeroforma arctica JP610]|eukprot:XP_014153323.1 hypothetical protein SARC_08188 [Sphaeroforma arctica JP610]